jgi:hypothetical protein
MTTQNDYGNMGDMIGHTFRIAGTEFTITGDGGDRWIVKSPTDPDMDGISKEVLRDAKARGDAVDITDQG